VGKTWLPDGAESPCRLGFTLEAVGRVRHADPSGRRGHIDRPGTLLHHVGQLVGQDPVPRRGAGSGSGSGETERWIAFITAPSGLPRGASNLATAALPMPSPPQLVRPTLWPGSQQRAGLLALAPADRSWPVASPYKPCPSPR
jgi:hypothetical protein